MTILEILKFIVKFYSIILFEKYKMFGYRFKKIDTDDLILKSHCSSTSITFLYFCKISKKIL